MQSYMLYLRRVSMLRFEDYIALLSGNDTVLLRVDFNLPIGSDGQFILNERLYSMIPVIKKLVSTGCSLILVSHLGRPKAGVWQERYSFSRLVPVLSALLQKPVTFLSKWPYQKTYLAPGCIALAENTRFLRGELENDKALVVKMLDGVNLVVMEAFACSHRAHASTLGIVEQAKRVCLGIHHLNELTSIRSFEQTKRPRVAVLGGKKLCTKLALIEHLVQQVDCLCLGGGLANTALHRCGFNLGTSWVEYDQLDHIQTIMDLCRQRGVRLLMPVDVAVTHGKIASEFSRFVDVGDLKPHDCVVDIGPKTIALYKSVLDEARSVYWNGPMGQYEYTFGLLGSKSVAEKIASLSAFTLVGGGDTIACLDRSGVGGFSHASTGGGAFLYVLVHGGTPVSKILEKAYVEAN